MKLGIGGKIDLNEIANETCLKIDSGNNILIGGRRVTSLASKFGTPLFIFDKNKIHENCEKLRNAFVNGIDNVGIYYAVKANGNIAVLEAIREKLSGVDVTSLGEIMAARKAGFDFGQMILHGNAKNDEELVCAIKNDIFMIVVDSINELFLIDKISRRLKKKANIGLRINYSINTGSPWDAFSKTSKFGISEKQIIEHYKILKKSRNVNLIGLHAHLGSQICDVMLYLKVIKKMFALLRNLSKKGIDVSVMNIGGGYPIPYKFTPRINVSNNETKYLIKPNLKEWGQKIVNAFHEECINTKMPRQPRLIIEPGRSVVGSSGALLTTVKSTKSSNNTNWLAVDAGCNTLPDCWTYDWYFESLPSKLIYRRNDMMAYNIGGPLCDSGDIIGLNRKLPIQERGSVLVFPQVGAYQLEQQSNFNLIPRARAILVHNKSVQIIQEREDIGNIVDFLSCKEHE